MALKVGDEAPDFKLTDQDGKEVNLKSLKGSPIILYFYPKDDTPGCTKEACGFRDAFPEIRSKGAVVLGVSLDDVYSHKKFAEKYNLPFQLLSDKDKQVSRSYGVLGVGGRRARRVTFIIDKEGRIRHIFKKVNVEQHPKEVLEILSKL
ncbi:MAG: thioredoxin-dependent thiol peroxidase [Nitrososphaerales archaeon]